MLIEINPLIFIVPALNLGLNQQGLNNIDTQKSFVARLPYAEWNNVKHASVPTSTNILNESGSTM